MSDLNVNNNSKSFGGGSYNADLPVNSSGAHGGAGDKKGGTGSSDLLDKAEQVARDGFLLSLQAKQITNKYAAAKEVR